MRATACKLTLARLEEAGNVYVPVLCVQTTPTGRGRISNIINNTTSIMSCVCTQNHDKCLLEKLVHLHFEVNL